MFNNTILSMTIVYHSIHLQLRITITRNKRVRHNELTFKPVWLI